MNEYKKENQRNQKQKNGIKNSTKISAKKVMVKRINTTNGILILYRQTSTFLNSPLNSE